jgi:hypothetical protein
MWKASEEGLSLVEACLKRALELALLVQPGPELIVED